jgi:hypothetical protein
MIFALVDFNPPFDNCVLFSYTINTTTSAQMHNLH